MADAVRGPGPLERIRRRVVPRIRVLFLVTCVVLAFVGALGAGPALTLGLAPLLAALAGGVVAMVNPAFPADVRARRAALLTAAVTGLLVLAVAGLAVLGNAGGVLAFAVLIMGTALGADWIARTLEDPVTAPEEAADPDRLPELLTGLPMSRLLAEWHRSAERLDRARDPATRAAVAEVRRLLLDEMARRDPAGVEEWLRRSDTPPDGLLRGDAEQPG